MGNVAMLELFQSFGVPLTDAKVPRLKLIGSYSVRLLGANVSALARVHKTATCYYRIYGLRTWRMLTFI